MTRTQHLYIVTGSSRGMGLAMATQLLSPQHVVLGMARHTSDELAHAAQRKAAHLEQWSQDLTDTLEAADRLTRWLDTLHAPGLASATLINNAAMIPTIGPLQQVPADELARAIRLGLEAPMALTSAFLKTTDRWVNEGWDGTRKVLNVSSGLGRRPMAAQAPYCAVKAGLDLFSRCTAMDEATQPRGAHIVSLAPGVIDTDMQTHLRTGEADWFPDRMRFVQLKAQGQLTSPEDAAAQVLAYLRRPDFGRNVVADVRD